MGLHIGETHSKLINGKPWQAEARFYEGKVRGFRLKRRAPTRWFLELLEVETGNCYKLYPDPFATTTPGKARNEAAQLLTTLGFQRIPS